VKNKQYWQYKKINYSEIYNTIKIHAATQRLSTQV